jgi:hypothetical protein
VASCIICYTEITVCGMKNSVWYIKHTYHLSNLTDVKESQHTGVQQKFEPTNQLDKPGTPSFKA